MEIRVAIVDDAKEDREQVIKCFSTIHIPNTHFQLDEFDDVSFTMNTAQYDLYLLDLDMPSITGLELAKRINETNPAARVIFISYREDLVFNTFAVESLYFVRKEFLKDDLLKALTKFANYFIKSNQVFIFDNGKNQEEIFYKDIYYFEVYKNDMYIVTKQNKYIIRKTMKKIIEEINDDSFVKIHMSFLVNLSNVNSIKDGVMILKNSVELKISRRKIKEISEAFVQYLLRRG